MNKVELCLFKESTGVISVYETDVGFDIPIGNILFVNMGGKEIFIGWKTNESFINGADSLRTVADEIEWLIAHPELCREIGYLEE